MVAIRSSGSTSKSTRSSPLSGVVTSRWSFLLWMRNEFRLDGSVHAERAAPRNRQVIAGQFHRAGLIAIPDRVDDAVMVTKRRASGLGARCLVLVRAPALAAPNRGFMRRPDHFE